MEATPWLVFAYPDMNWNDVVATAKLHDLQNRLGFATCVAARKADELGNHKLANQLFEMEQTLEPSRLAREDTLCNARMTNAERKWLRTNRPESAEKWKILTNMLPRYLDQYVD